MFQFTASAHSDGATLFTTDNTGSANVYMVPLPGAAAGGLALIGVIGIARRSRRSTGADETLPL